MENAITLEDIEIGALTLHEACEQSPDLTRAEMEGLVASIREDGVLCPLQVSADLQVLDGRHRLQAAKQLRLTHVPCLVVDADAEALAVEMLVSGRRLAKGPACYYALRMGFREWLDHANVRRIQALKRGAEDGVAHSMRNGEDLSGCLLSRQRDDLDRLRGYDLDENKASLARRLGVSERLLDQAIELVSLVDAWGSEEWTNPDDGVTRTWRKQIDHRLCVEGQGLGSCLKAIKNAHNERALTGGGSEKLSRRQKPPLQFAKFLKKSSAHLRQYETLPEPDRAAVNETASKQVLSWPKDVQLAVREALVAAKITRD